MSQKASILIAESERAIRESVEMILMDEDYCCHTADSFQALLEIIDLHEFDIIIADINILSGKIERLNFILQNMPSPPTILVTLSYHQVREMLPLMKHGASEYLLKPFLFEDLLNRIQRILELRSHTQNSPST